MVAVKRELTVRGEQVERVFMNYCENKYFVNRQYQRKLIWSIEEKRNFIDSIRKGFPVPIILLAEPLGGQTGILEIIDGMQRMNATMSFITNDFSIDDGYFDLNTFATTKDLLDSGVIQQKTPVLDRKECIKIASYPLPISIYEAAERVSVEEVFRRINSGGRQLSRQELRAAGATCLFAECVREISAEVRGDTSNTDLLSLNEIKKISITNKDLDYGINADDVFWIKNGILSKEQLRQSRDEEVIADIVAYMVSEKPIASRTEFLDTYYNVFPDEARFKEIDQAIKKRGGELICDDYRLVQDSIRKILDVEKKTFSALLFPDRQNKYPIPRYYQVVFLAFHKLMVKEGKSICDRIGLGKALSKAGKDIVILEGKWSADRRGKAVNSLVGGIQDYFEVQSAPDPARMHWITKLENLLTNSFTEQAAYDFKQGFYNLGSSPSFDEESFEKILETCAAIANIGKGHKGYVIVGVAENKKTAERVKQLFGIEYVSYNGFHITGVEHEARFVEKNLDQLFQDIVERIERSRLSDPLKSYINRNVKTIRYYDKALFVFEVAGQNEPSTYGDEWFERKGAQVKKIEHKDVAGLFDRFR